MGVDVSGYGNAGITNEERKAIVAKSDSKLDTSTKELEKVAQSDSKLDVSLSTEEKVNLSVTPEQIKAKGKDLDKPSSLNFNVANKKAEKAIVMPDIQQLAPIPDPGTVTFPDRRTGFQRDYIGPFNSLSDAKQYGREVMLKPYHTLNGHQEKLFNQVNNGANAVILENTKTGQFYIALSSINPEDFPKHFEYTGYDVTKPYGY